MSTAAAPIFGAIAGAIILGVADMLMKSQRWVAGSLLYLAVCPAAYMAFQSPSYRVIANVWAAAAVAFSISVSVAYYHEPMNIRKYIVSGLILAAMLLED